jgi:uncharacterized protein (DUF1330 family)
VIAITLCVLLSAVPGRDDALSDYEDRVLALLADHGGSVVVRMRAAEGPYTEVQVLEFASAQGLEAFQSDPRRLALSELRAASVASTTVIRGAQIA